MKNLNIFLMVLALSITSACIKDDFVEDTIDASLRIVTNIETIEIDSEVQFDAMYLNNVGQQTDVQIVWSSSDAQIISMSKEGLAKAVGFGTVTIKAEYSDGTISVQDLVEVAVGESTIVGTNSVSGKITTTSSYVLEGDFVFVETSTGVNLSFADNYKASAALPGLYVFLSNNKNSIADAFEVGEVKTFNGAHDYNVKDIGFEDFKYLLYFCKPFNVKVGDGEL